MNIEEFYDRRNAIEKDTLIEQLQNEITQLTTELKEERRKLDLIQKSLLEHVWNELKKI